MAPATGQSDWVQVLVDRWLIGDRRAPKIAREYAREALRGMVDADDAATVQLVLCELVTNAVLHVGGRVGVRVEAATGTVRVSVSDSSARVPVVRRSLNEQQVSGRGLHLIDRLSRTWGAELEPGGKRVWSELALRTTVVRSGVSTSV